MNAQQEYAAIGASFGFYGRWGSTSWQELGTVGGVDLSRGKGLDSWVKEAFLEKMGGDNFASRGAFAAAKMRIENVWRYTTALNHWQDEREFAKKFPIFEKAFSQALAASRSSK